MQVWKIAAALGVALVLGGCWDEEAAIQGAWQGDLPSDFGLTGTERLTFADGRMESRLEVDLGPREGTLLAEYRYDITESAIVFELESVETLAEEPADRALLESILARSPEVARGEVRFRGADQFTLRLDGIDRTYRRVR